MKKLVAMVFFAMVAGNAVAQAGGSAEGAGAGAGGATAGVTAGTIATIAVAVVGIAAAASSSSSSNNTTWQGSVVFGISAGANSYLGR